MKQGASIRSRLVALRPALLSDALGKSGAMDHDMRCWSRRCRMAGPATTLRVHPADILMVGKALSLCPKGNVLVIDGQSELDTALWGGIATICARLKGVEGVVIDGAIRDVAEIRRQTLPVFARAAVPNAGGAEYPGEIDVPVQCGGAVVCPGDWVISDHDGIVVIPAGRVAEVAERAERLRSVEAELYARVRKGADLAELLRYDELLAAKDRTSGLPQMRLSAKSTRSGR